MDETKLSKLLSLILRHKPEIINIKLDNHGWANVEEVITGIRKLGYQFDFKSLEAVVKNNNKERFSFNACKTKIRANQGHSLNVDIELEEVTPPETLYHGTSERFLPIIIQEGIKNKNAIMCICQAILKQHL